MRVYRSTEPGRLFAGAETPSQSGSSPVRGMTFQRPTAGGDLFLLGSAGHSVGEGCRSLHRSAIRSNPLDDPSTSAPSGGRCARLQCGPPSMTFTATCRMARYLPRWAIAASTGLPTAFGFFISTEPRCNTRCQRSKNGSPAFFGEATTCWRRRGNCRGSQPNGRRSSIVSTKFGHPPRTYRRPCSARSRCQFSAFAMLASRTWRQIWINRTSGFRRTASRFLIFSISVRARQGKILGL